MSISGKLTKKLVATLGPGRHGDGAGLYLVVDPTPAQARRWVVRVTIKGRRNANGGPLRTDFGIGSAALVSLSDARDKALEYRRLARQGVDPKETSDHAVPTFEEVARQVHLERMPTWKNPKHGQQWINTLAQYAFPKIGHRRVSEIGQPQILEVLGPIWTEKHETAKRLAQRIKIVLDVARSKGFRDGENPVSVIRDANVLPKVSQKPTHHGALPWNAMPDFFAQLAAREEVAAKALRMTCLTASRTGEVLGMQWDEIDFEEGVWTCPAERMKTGVPHRVPLTSEMVDVLNSLKALKSKFVFEGQKRHRPLSNMAMSMLLRRMGLQGVTVHGFRSTFRDWATEVAEVPREVAEKSLAHTFGSRVERAYARSDLLEQRRALLEKWSAFLAGSGSDEV